MSDLCKCKNCVPTPTDISTLLYQAAEEILDVLKVEDCNKSERAGVEGVLAKLLADARNLPTS